MSDSQHYNLVRAAYRLGGYNTGTKLFLFQKFIILPTCLILFTLAAIKLKFSKGILETTEISQSISTYGHGLTRNLVALIHARDLEQLASRSHFWKFNTFGEKMERQLRKRMKTVEFINWLYPGGTLVVAIGAGVSPFLYQDRDLPQPCWVPVDALLPIIYFLQLFFFLDLAFIDVVIDNSLLLMCGDLEIQFVLLRTALQTVRFSDKQQSYHTLRKCYQHHVFLISVHQQLQKTFSVFFFMQYFLSVGGIVVQLYTLNEVDLTWDQLLTAIFYIFGVVGQCSFGFILASNLETETERLAGEIYSTDWYNVDDLNLRKRILFMMMSAQKPLFLNGAGFFTVNRMMLVEIYRIGFSISVLVRQL